MQLKKKYKVKKFQNKKKILSLNKEKSLTQKEINNKIIRKNIRKNKDKNLIDSNTHSKSNSNLLLNLKRIRQNKNKAKRVRISLQDLELILTHFHNYLWNQNSRNQLLFIK